MVLPVRHFKYYLSEMLFTARTDHSALQWLMPFKEPEGQVARWLGELQAYADALSRHLCAAAGCLYCEKREAKEGELRAEEDDGSIQ